MQYDEEEFRKFRKHLMSEHGDFSVFFGSDYVAFQYGDEKSFAVGYPPIGENRPVRDKRMMGIVVMSQLFALMGSKAASSAMK